ncbi:hypothetical protein SLEP1_g12700 [Rubroshorea leprosula]|uniref:RNA-directed DNA polymerase, eukaryota, reverse transcriptase zinc-binding domain protein n=1 Tax=Rubroshorea leprosula TaxID=152421 RepID=A0AAV5IJ78_9ROSI|nr:hypothetical protein SLEP1_g12700 [Rubroshorea leprosula]
MLDFGIRAFGCFDDGFIRKLGNGSNTRFWKDAWMGSSPLMFSFPCLFCLTLSKDTLVVELKLDVRVDKFIWKHCSIGYSSKQAYKFLDDFPPALMRNVAR